MEGRQRYALTFHACLWPGKQKQLQLGCKAGGRRILQSLPGGVGVSVATANARLLPGALRPCCCRVHTHAPGEFSYVWSTCSRLSVRPSSLSIQLRQLSVLPGALRHRSCSRTTSCNWSAKATSRKCQCRHQGCATRPSFGSGGTKQRGFCAQHKGWPMSAQGKCGHQGCTKEPSFGSGGSGKAEFCVQRKEQGVVDVVNNHRRCAHSACAKMPYFG